MLNHINLQLFAEVGATNTTATLSAEMQIHYDKTLIQKAGPKLVHEKFADHKKIPLRAGLTVDFRSIGSFPKLTTPIQEGVTPEPGAIKVTNLRATVQQYGGYVPVTDVLDMTAADPLIVETTEKSGEQMGLTRDTILRDILHTCPHVFYAPSVDGDTVTPVNSRKELTANSKLTVRVVQKIVARLKTMNAPTFDGDYICILHPAIATDIMNDKLWRDAYTYTDPENIRAGELGRIAGVRFYDSSEAKIFNDESCPEGLAVYSCLFFGKGAYATTDLEGQGGGEVIVKPKESGGTENPLNLYGTIGWKTLFAGVILNPEYLVRLECSSTDFPTAEAN